MALESKPVRWTVDARLNCVSSRVSQTRQNPTHTCKTLWRGVMFAVAVATWCNLTGDPVQTCHQGDPALADAPGSISGTTVIQQGRDMWWKERTVIFCFSVNIPSVEPAGQGSLPYADLK